MAAKKKPEPEAPSDPSSYSRDSARSSYSVNKSKDVDPDSGQMVIQEVAKGE